MRLNRKAENEEKNEDSFSNVYVRCVLLDASFHTLSNVLSLDVGRSCCQAVRWSYKISDIVTSPPPVAFGCETRKWPSVKLRH